MLKLISSQAIATSQYLNKPLRSEGEVKATIIMKHRRARYHRRMVRDAKNRADLLRHNGLRLAKTFNPSEYNPV